MFDINLYSSPKIFFFFQPQFPCKVSCLESLAVWLPQLWSFCSWSSSEDPKRVVVPMVALVQEAKMVRTLLSFPKTNWTKAPTVSVTIPQKWKSKLEHHLGNGFLKFSFARIFLNFLSYFLGHIFDDFSKFDSSIFGVLHSENSSKEIAKKVKKSLILGSWVSSNFLLQYFFFQFV